MNSNRLFSKKDEDALQVKPELGKGMLYKRTQISMLSYIKIYVIMILRADSWIIMRNCQIMLLFKH